MTAIKTMDIKLERTIPAPATEVFDAWLDPNTPVNPFSGAKKLIFDLKKDALFNFVHHHDGKDLSHYGRFDVLDRPSKAQYTWMSPYTRGLETVVTATFTAKGDETLVSLTHAGLPDDDYGRAHDGGWSGYLKKLDAMFPAGK
ncbi:MAG: SRPBCC domain-containing protein [Gemmatimonadota bacterium]|nr:SRPBCC domain-containing protein [Gemmatimonadota bacterium]